MQSLQWLQVLPEDDDKTRQKKKKLAKSYKSKMRFQKKDLEQKQRQQSWLNFKSGKGAKKKTGFLTGKGRCTVGARVSRLLPLSIVGMGTNVLMIDD